MKNFIILLGLLVPVSASAYIGPGVGAGTFGVVIGIIVSIFLALFAILWYPIKRFLKKRKKSKITTPSVDKDL